MGNLLNRDSLGSVPGVQSILVTLKLIFSIYLKHLDKIHFKHILNKNYKQ
jgi:hypothetical protein